MLALRPSLVTRAPAGLPSLARRAGGVASARRVVVSKAAAPAAPGAPRRASGAKAGRGAVACAAAKKEGEGGAAYFQTYLSTAPVLTFAFLWFMSALIIEINRFFPDPLTMSGLLIK